MKDLKYYLYVSDAKVNMLHAQIPSSLQKKFALDLNTPSQESPAFRHGEEWRVL